VRDFILRLESSFETLLETLQDRATHLPSRVRSLIWILAAVPLLAERGIHIAPEREVRNELEARLPQARRATAKRVAAAV